MLVARGLPRELAPMLPLLAPRAERGRRGVAKLGDARFGLAPRADCGRRGLGGRARSSADKEIAAGMAAARSDAVFRGLSPETALSAAVLWTKMLKGLPRTCLRSMGRTEPSLPTMTLRLYLPETGIM